MFAKICQHIIYLLANIHTQLTEIVANAFNCAIIEWDRLRSKPQSRCRSPKATTDTDILIHYTHTIRSHKAGMINSGLRLPVVDNHDNNKSRRKHMKQQNIFALSLARSSVAPFAISYSTYILNSCTLHSQRILVSFFFVVRIRN